jgi:hypothetical protein
MLTGACELAALCNASFGRLAASSEQLDECEPADCADIIFQGVPLNTFSAPPHAITSSAVRCTALSCCSCGLKVVKLSKSVNIESATCARTSAILISPITSLKFSTARTPPAPPNPTNPAALLFHSWKRKSIAFFNAAEVAWLYSGVTKI